MTLYLSEHFTLDEATHSSTADRLDIDNTVVSSEVLSNAKIAAVKMEKVRIILAKPISIDSWIRCLSLNRALKSKDTSKHVLGLAVDFVCPQFGTPQQICEHLIKYQDLLRFDQLILEHTWVHISWCSPDSKPRGEVLTLLETGGYAIGLTDKKGTKLCLKTVEPTND